jgi:phage-related protein
MTERPVVFFGTSRADIRAFPGLASNKIGRQIRRVQRGLDPIDWKPMPSIGKGVREIRVRDAGGAFRAIYVVEGGDGALVVLHAFEKKTQKTPKPDVELARKRLQAFLQAR